MSIGKWIVVVFVLFAAFIGTLVTICVRQDISLVSKEYYKEELAYQDQIERMENTSQLSKKPSLVRSADKLLLKFSGEEAAKGKLKLFCPSNSKLDTEFAFDSQENSSMSFALAPQQRGMFRAKLLWTSNGKEYFYEEVIYL
jgi:hypothetical protein